MKSTLAALLAFGILSLPGCSKTPANQVGTGEVKINEKVWATYAWSHNRLAYVIYFTPPPTFNPDGAAAKLTSSSAKDGDVFEGNMEGAPNGKFNYKCEAKLGNMTIEGRAFRSANGNAFLVLPGQPKQTQQISIGFVSGPKEADQAAGYFESEVRRLVKETPKIKEFPGPPPSPTKKK